MSRTARIIAGGYPHHIVHRGHNRQDIFRDDEDRKLLIWLFRHYLGTYQCRLLAYCLMRNHIHLMVLPEHREALSDLMHGVSFRYAMYFNQTSERTGSLWESRYFSSVITEELYMWRTAKYICLNPVRVGVTDDPAEFEWSSAKDLMYGKKGLLPVDDQYLEGRREDFRSMVLYPHEVSEINYLLQRNLPYTSALGLINLGEAAGVSLTTKPRGRPRKKFN